MVFDAVGKRSALRIAAIAFCAAGILSVGPAKAQDPAAIVDERRAALKRAGAALTGINDYVRQDKGTQADVQAAVAVLVEVSGAMKNWFPEGTAIGVGNSEARPLIWQQKPDFEAKIATFQAEAKNFVPIAATGDKAAIGKQVGVTFASCKACHDVYREKK